MSLAIIKSRIQKFLKSPMPQVMSLSGRWGIGKTYSWFQFYSEVEEKNELAILNYSYVSLFGINSLEEMKFQIVANLKTRGKREDRVANIVSYGEKAGNFIFKASSFFKTPKFDISSAFARLGFFWFKNAVVCIDDVERRGDGLKLKDILGIANFLKEEKQCKVVLISNIGEHKEDESIIKLYSEKVFDTTIVMDLTSEECVEIAFKKRGVVQDTLGKSAVKLQIKNIRLLKKIEKSSMELESLLKKLGFDEKILRQGISTLTLFMASKMSEDGNLPSYDFVRYFQGFLKLGPSEEEKKWYQSLLDYGYQSTDDFDKEIAGYVEKGFFDETQIKLKAENLKIRMSDAAREERFHEAWGLYHDTFEDNAPDVINKLTSTFKEGAKLISPLNLNGTVCVLRELGATDKAEEIIDFYIAERANEKEVFNLDDYSFAGDVTDAQIISKFNLKYKSFFTQIPFAEVLEKIANEQKWNWSDALILADGTEADFYNFFKAVTGEMLRKSIRICLQFAGHINRPACQIVHDKTIGALKRIAQESSINRRRVSRYIQLTDLNQNNAPTAQGQETG